MVLEDEVEKLICEWAEDEGGDALKLVIDGERGFPDRTLFMPGGIIAIGEIKKPRGGRRSEQQKRRVARLRALGFEAGFWKNVDDAKRAVERAAAARISKIR